MKSTLDTSSLLLLLFFLVGIAGGCVRHAPYSIGIIRSVSELYWEGTSFAEWLNPLAAPSWVRAPWFLCSPRQPLLSLIMLTLASCMAPFS